MTSLMKISCRLRQPTLSPSFTQEGYHYEFQIQGYHNLYYKMIDIMTLFDILKIIHISYIHIHDKWFSNHLSQGFMFIHVSSKRHSCT